MTAIVYKDRTLWADDSSQIKSESHGHTYFKSQLKVFSTAWMAIAITGPTVDFKSVEWLAFVLGPLLTELQKVDGIKNVRFTIPEGVLNKDHGAILITKDQVFVMNPNTCVFIEEAPEVIQTMGSEYMLLDYALKIMGKDVNEAYELVLRHSVIGFHTERNYQDMDSLTPLPKAPPEKKVRKKKVAE